MEHLAALQNALRGCLPQAERSQDDLVPQLRWAVSRIQTLHHEKEDLKAENESLRAQLRWAVSRVQTLHDEAATKKESGKKSPTTVHDDLMHQV